MRVFNMKKASFFVWLVFCFSFLACNSSFAVFFSSDKLQLDRQMENLVNSGVEHLKNTTKEQAYKDFSDVHGKFINGIDYLFVYDFQGKCLAHGGNQEYVGKNLLSHKDKFGIQVIKLLIQVAKSGGGFAGYYWLNPKTGKEQFKISYVKAIDKDTLIGTSHPIPQVLYKD